jgi:hypothetical protein
VYIRTAGLVYIRTAGLVYIRTAGLVYIRTAGLVYIRTAGLVLTGLGLFSFAFPATADGAGVVIGRLPFAPQEDAEGAPGPLAQPTRPPFKRSSTWRARTISF